MIFFESTLFLVDFFTKTLNWCSDWNGTWLMEWIERGKKVDVHQFSDLPIASWKTIARKFFYFWKNDVDKSPAGLATAISSPRRQRRWCMFSIGYLLSWTCHSTLYLLRLIKMERHGGGCVYTQPRYSTKRKTVVPPLLRVGHNSQPSLAFCQFC